MEFQMDVLILGVKRIDFENREKGEVIKGTRIYFAEFVDTDNQKGYFYTDKATSLYLKDDLVSYDKISKILIERKFQPFIVKGNYKIESTSKLPKLLNLEI